MKGGPRNAAGEGAVDPSYAQGSNLRWVVDALTTRRDEILERWLDAASSQPFHRDHPERTVTDHIPALFDALVATLREDADRGTDPGAPLDAPDIRKAAEGHARFRAAQGLPPAAIVVEFRLLRQEIWYALRASIPDDAPVSDVLGAEIVVNDALDGAISVGLATLITHIDEVREDFLATTVHEVRQPITVIKGTAQLALRGLRRPKPDLERIADALRRIEADADRMAEQLNTLVDVSRAAVGALDLHVATVDLARLARDTADELGPETIRRIEWRVAAGANVAGRWDPFRLQQVVRNLLSNAVKYSPPGSPIVVAVEEVGGGVQLSVRDHGVGIRPEDLPRLFQRFSRGRDVVERQIEGIGIGLYLCRLIVEAHGGRIWAESEGPNQGATVRFWLPRATSGTAGRQ